HPLRVQHWAISDLNPWLAWLGPAAAVVKANRQALGPESPARQFERMLSEGISGAWDFYRDLRDATAEALFYQTYANLVALYQIEGAEAGLGPHPGLAAGRELPFVQAALAAIAQGGYAEAVARVGALIERHGVPLPLSRLEMRQELIERYADLLPETTREQQRRIRGEQEIIVHYEPERAVQTLPRLLANPADRARLRTLLDRILADKRIWRMQPTLEQVAMAERLRKLLAGKPRPRPGPGPARRRPAWATRAAHVPQAPRSRRLRAVSRRGRNVSRMRQ
ncbi:MAG TPA: DUF3141 domain-containing protein, partial [Candidatus Sulfotelmatobacter sp.]|nr:DUF3141 domain-containing protein [Candidatus Sulfotelmatobacter sp.]